MLELALVVKEKCSENARRANVVIYESPEALLGYFWDVRSTIISAADC